jgi:DUF4097 and DUF4098 domain-containing protein YvlB
MASIKVTKGDLAYAYNIRIQQGTDWSLDVTLLDSNGNAVNLTGATFKGQIRDTFAPKGTKLADFTITIVNASAGSLTINSPNTTNDSTKITATAGVYDIEMTDSSAKISRILQGTVEFLPEVTV